MTRARAGLAAYLTGSALIDAGRRVDVRARPDAVWRGCAPGRIPQGRWPADFGRSLALSQQFAVNEIMSRLDNAAGLLAVNGPPGTGKTTLLRDLIAAIVVAGPGASRNCRAPPTRSTRARRTAGSPGTYGTRSRR